MVKEIEADAKTVCRSAPHADPGREKGRGRSQGGGRARHRGGFAKRLGARAQPAMATRRPALPSRRATACTARLNAARSTRCWRLAAMAACTRCRWPAARRARRRPAGHHADRAGIGHAAAALLCRPGQAPRCCCPARAATAFWRRWKHGLAPEGRQGLHHLGEGETVCVPSHAAGSGRRSAATCRHACGLCLGGGAHPDVRDQRTQDHGQRRPWPDADRPGSPKTSWRVPPPTRAASASRA
jgi:hypothetical protein